jgi:hypothetical protein
LYIPAANQNWASFFARLALLNGTDLGDLGVDVAAHILKIGRENLQGKGAR